MSTAASLDSSLAALALNPALIDQILPVEIIAACLDAVLPPLTSGPDAMEEMEERQVELIRRRTICKRWRAIFPATTEYVVSQRGQLTRLREVMELDTERGSKARSLMIAYYEAGVEISDTTGLILALPMLESLSILPPTSSQLMIPLSSLVRLKKIDININNFDEIGLAQYVAFNSFQSYHCADSDSLQNLE
jgi:hypothetical protein